MTVGRLPGSDTEGGASNGGRGRLGLFAVAAWTWASADQQAGIVQRLDPVGIHGTPNKETLMKLRTVFGVAVALVLLAASVGHAQDRTAVKGWRIGWLAAPSAASGTFELDGLREGLRALNYVEGRNITIEARWGDGDLTRLAALGRELAALKVDVIFTAGTPATLAAMAATRAIPIIFGRVAFPDQTGIVSSLARPGGNLTGVTFIGPEYGK